MAEEYEVHLRRKNFPDETACGLKDAVLRITVKSLVTCGQCKRTEAYRQAKELPDE